MYGYKKVSNGFLKSMTGTCPMSDARPVTVVWDNVCPDTGFVQYVIGSEEVDV